MKAGSMYPILMRLADQGMLETTWAAEAELGGRLGILSAYWNRPCALATQLTAAARTSSIATTSAAAPTVAMPRLAGEHP